MILTTEGALSPVDINPTDSGTVGEKSCQDVARGTSCTDFSCTGFVVVVFWVWTVLPKQFYSLILVESYEFFKIRHFIACFREIYGNFSLFVDSSILILYVAYS